MGYAPVSIVMYGLEVSEEVAEAIYERFGNNGDSLNIPGKENFIFHRIGDRYFRRGAPQQQPITPYTQHQPNGKVFYPSLVSEGAHSSAESLEFNPGSDHFFGIFIASRGYGHQDNTNYFMQNLPPEAVRAFDNLIAPILREMRINAAPQLLVTQQIW